MSLDGCPALLCPKTRLLSQTLMFDEEAKDSRSASLHAASSSLSSSATSGFGESYSLANPSIHAGEEIPQPTIFNGKLKGYQLKGMNWLANLYEQVKLSANVGQMPLARRPPLFLQRSNINTERDLSVLCFSPGCRESMGSWQTRWGWGRRCRASPCWHTLQR